MLVLPVDPDTYSVPFVALILLGVSASSAYLAVLVARRFYYRLGYGDCLRTFRGSPR